MKATSKKVLLQGLAVMTALYAMTATANAGCPASLPMGSQLTCTHTPVFNPDAKVDALLQVLAR